MHISRRSCWAWPIRRRPRSVGRSRPAPRAMGDGRKVAQTLIDTLGMLAEKTEGRLEHDERQLLDQAVTALRFRFVQTTPRP